jgi:replicative DNA helicase
MQFENEELERQVLSAMMLSAEDRLTAFSILPTLDCFQLDQHKVIAKAIQALQDAGEHVDLETTVATIKKSGLLKEAGGLRSISKVFASLKQPGHTETHCRLLIELYLKAKVYMFSLELLQKSQSDSGDIFDLFSEYQSKFDNILASTITKSDDDFQKQLDESAKIWLNSQPGDIAGYRTGIAALDKLCGGLTNGELTVIGARPGQGKTALVVSLIRNLAMQGIGSGLFSLEMTKHELCQRLASQESNVFAYKIKQGDMNQYDKTALYEAIHRMKKWPIKISDEGYLNISKIRSKATMWKNKHKMQVLFVDYIGLVNSVNQKETNRVNIIGEISRGLKLLAKELQIPVVALSQLSRRVDERSDKMPLMSDLRESGSVEQDADVIWMMLRPEYYFEPSATTKVGSAELPNAGLCLIDQVKMRSGSTGIIPLRFDAPLMHLKDYESNSNF